MAALAEFRWRQILTPLLNNCWDDCKAQVGPIYFWIRDSGPLRPGYGTGPVKSLGSKRSSRGKACDRAIRQASNPGYIRLQAWGDAARGWHLLRVSRLAPSLPHRP